jgi:hypothetical protein
VEMPPVQSTRQRSATHSPFEENKGKMWGCCSSLPSNRALHKTTPLCDLDIAKAFGINTIFCRIVYACFRGSQISFCCWFISSLFSRFGSKNIACVLLKVSSLLLVGNFGDF